MGRKLRVWIPDYFYHIVCRGNRRDALFRDDGDFLTFLYILRKVFERYPFEISSYCLMTNHLHLQLRSQEQPISKIMLLINKRYANYYNNKYKLTGHVFEKRYYDKIVMNKKGLLDVSRYIHFNPVEANMVELPERYRWSSYQFYQGTNGDKPPYINLQVLLDCFSGCLEEQRKLYCEWCLSPPE